MEFLPHNDGGIVLDGTQIRASSVEALAVHTGTVVQHLAAQLGVTLPPVSMRLSARREREAERLCRDEGHRLSHIGAWCQYELTTGRSLTPSQRVCAAARLARAWEQGFAGPVGPLP